LEIQELSAGGGADIVMFGMMADDGGGCFGVDEDKG
jgi:hypothetical protein